MSPTVHLWAAVPPLFLTAEYRQLIQMLLVVSPYFQCQWHLWPLRKRWHQKHLESALTNHVTKLRISCAIWDRPTPETALYWFQEKVWIWWKRVTALQLQIYRFFKSNTEKHRSSLITHENDRDSPTEKNTENSTDILPFLNLPPVCSFEGLSKLSELSAAAQTIEDMANQLLQARPESITANQPPSGKTETYIAKPACPGPSIDNQVLPLCQITVKIGNEAIVRRKIKGSKLFPKKRKRKSWRQEGIGQRSSAEESVGSPSLRVRAGVTTSATEKEKYNDPNDPETDNLWRPYYTYKPKKKGKKLKEKKQDETSEMLH